VNNSFSASNTSRLEMLYSVITGSERIACIYGRYYLQMRQKWAITFAILLGYELAIPSYHVKTAPSKANGPLLRRLPKLSNGNDRATGSCNHHHPINRTAICSRRIRSLYLATLVWYTKFLMFSLKVGAKIWMI
jgi:hypothetical protein